MNKMPIQNTRYTIIFAIVSGFVLFILSALWGAYFLPNIPMDEGAVTDWISIEGPSGDMQYEPGGFSSDIDRLIYFHNIEMQNRNKYWVFFTIALGALFGRLAFYNIPKWSGISKADLDRANSQATGMVIGAVIAIFMPLLFSWILPSPDTWFPSFVIDYANQRQLDVLSELEMRAAQSAQ